MTVETKLDITVTVMARGVHKAGYRGDATCPPEPRHIEDLLVRLGATDITNYVEHNDELRAEIEDALLETVDGMAEDAAVSRWEDAQRDRAAGL